MKGKGCLKKGVALLCMGTLLLGAVGCGKKSDSQGTSGKGQEAGLPLTELTLPLSEEKVELSVWMDIWQSELVNSPDELPSYQELEERTNVHINWTYLTSSEAQEKFGLLIASGEIPDIVRDVNYYYPGGVEKSIEEGLFIDTNDLVENYMPNYKALLAAHPDAEKAVRTDSGRYVIFNLNGNDDDIKLEDDYVGPIIRQDWLEELGLAVPVTLDDWHTVLTAFKEQKGCEAPLMLGPNGYLTQSGAFLTAFGVLPEFYVEDGTVKFGPLEEGYRSYVELMRQWFSEGLIDPNFTANNATFMPPTDYLATGRAGAADCIPNFCSNQLAIMGYTDNMDLNWQGVPYPVLNAGDTELSGYSLSKYADNSYGISASCKNPEIAAMWLDYQYTEDGMALMNYGIEGESYTVDEDGKYHLTDVILNNPNHVPSQAHYLYCNYAFGRYNWDRQREANSSYEVTKAAQKNWIVADHSKVYPQYTSMTAEEGVEYSSKYTAVSTLVQEKTVKYIMGTEAMDTYDRFLEDLVTYGIEDCIRIKQDAYDRYISR